MELLKNSHEKERRQALARTIEGLLKKSDALYGRELDEALRKVRLHFWLDALEDLNRPKSLMDAFSIHWRFCRHYPRVCDILMLMPEDAFRNTGRGFHGRLVHGGRHDN